MAFLAQPIPRYRTTILEDRGELRRLLPEWWALWSRTARATPFSSPAWLLPWWDAFQPGDLFAAAVRRDGLLVGFAPFYIKDGALGRRLLPLGIGVTDDLDVLIDGAPVGEVAAAMVDAYRHRTVRWDSWSLEEMAPDALARHLPVGPLLVGERAQSARPVRRSPTVSPRGAGRAQGVAGARPGTGSPVTTKSGSSRPNPRPRGVVRGARLAPHPALGGVR